MQLFHVIWSEFTFHNGFSVVSIFYIDLAVHVCDPMTEFDCSGGFREHCVPRDAVCDGTMDCFGGEDENRAHCLPKNGENF